PKEYELLRLLASQPGRVFSTAEILRAVWPERCDVSGLEDVKKYIYFLRRRLHDHSHPLIVQTVRGFGYKLVADAPPSPRRSAADGT
ncbi:MAG TPA: winged helix-turn-helix domain-containing protein, partial [Limnochordia bacterium]